MIRIFIRTVSLISLLLAGFRAFSLDLTDFSDTLSDTFYSYTGENEGNTTFRSLLIPMGGRAESLGNAYTASANDVSYIDYNPAASCLLDKTQLAFFHNSWIADSAMETIAATIRLENLGLGAKLSCFYVPFSEYDSFGIKTTGGYYSETTASINASYNFHAGYTFKGLALGGNLKAGWRSIPDYADDDTGEIIRNSGLDQSAFALMGDAGLILQFNALKFFVSREPNLKAGFSALNLGAAFTGFSSGLEVDDGLPTIFAAGISYQPLKPLIFSLDFKQPVNLLSPSDYLNFSISSGVQAVITKYVSVLSGFELKGANPRFSAGFEFEFSSFRLNLNYTLDLTSSLNPVNHISLGAKILLGDRGRAAKQKEVDRLYNEGIALFANREYEKAIEKWKEVLKIDRYFDPASKGIKAAQDYLDMLRDYGNI